MTADLHGSTVFVLDTFMRRGTLHADVAHVRARDKRNTAANSSTSFSLGTLSTVKVQDLSSTRVELVVTTVHGRDIHLEKVGGKLQNLDLLPLPLPSMQAPTLKGPMSNGDNEIVTVAPQAALHHTQTFGTAKEPHRTEPRADQMWSGWILDVPHSVQFCAQPHRCVTCKGSGGAKVEDKGNYQVTDADVLRAFPNVIVVKAPQQKRHFMTRRYLLEILLHFYSSLNCREIRRKLMDVCAAQTLHADLLWQAHATPKAEVLRWTVRQAFGKTLGNIVESLQSKLFVYNGQGIRHDGNMKLAKRVMVPKERIFPRLGRKRRILGSRKRFGRVLLAFTGWVVFLEIWKSTVRLNSI